MSVGFLRTTVVLLLLLLAVPAAAADNGSEELVLFWGNGCPHCAREREFLAELAGEYPELTIVQYEVWYDEENRNLFVATMAALGREPRAVPTTVFGDLVWEGFGDTTPTEIRRAVSAVFATEATTAPPSPEPDTVDIPLIGRVSVDVDSLLVSTLAIGFVDGFNPCSLWVLSMLLALVLHTRSRRRVLMVGVVFLTVTTLLYGLYIAGLYSVLSYVAYVDWIRVAVALVALAFGLVSLKDYWWFGSGPSLGIAARHKPGLYRKMRRIAVADRPLPQVLGGTALLAVGVSLIETPCTAGFPLMWSNLLADAGVQMGTAVALFAVYMAVFLIDELAVLGAAVVAMRVTKLQERRGRVLRLVGGMVMVSLAGVIVVRPALMESVTGAVVVFAVAALLAAVVYVVDRRRTQEPARQGRRGAGDDRMRALSAERSPRG